MSNARSRVAHDLTNTSCATLATTRKESLEALRDEILMMAQETHAAMSELQQQHAQRLAESAQLKTSALQLRAQHEEGTLLLTAASEALSAATTETGGSYLIVIDTTFQKSGLAAHAHSTRSHPLAEAARQELQHRQGELRGKQDALSAARAQCSRVVLETAEAEDAARSTRQALERDEAARCETVADGNQQASGALQPSATCVG